MYDLYAIPDYEEGYLYEMRYTKVWLSDFENSMIAGHPAFEVENVKVTRPKIALHKNK